MSAALLRPTTLPLPRPRVETDSDLLDRLRRVHAQTRCLPRSDLFGACAILQSDRCCESAAAIETLMRHLGDAIGTLPRIHREGSAEMSFDEAWLLRLVESARGGDAASLRFGLNRVNAAHRRAVGYLLGKIAETA